MNTLSVTTQAGSAECGHGSQPGVRPVGLETQSRGEVSSLVTLLMCVCVCVVVVAHKPQSLSQICNQHRLNGSSAIVSSAQQSCIKIC